MTGVASSSGGQRGHQQWLVGDDDPFVTTGRLLSGVEPQLVSCYGARRWLLSVLDTHRHGSPVTWDWESVQDPSLRESLRRAGWALVNLPTPEELLEHKTGGSRAKWPSPGTIICHLIEWGRFASWLSARGIHRLCDVSVDDLENYVAQIQPRKRVARALYPITVLWGLAPHLLEQDRIPMPPWENDMGLADYLPPAEASNENSTPPIHPAVMSPLLIWALRFVDDFAEDIIGAWQEYQRLESQIAERSEPEGYERVKTLLESYRARSLPLPGTTTRKPGAANRYLAGMARARPLQVTGYVAKRMRGYPVGTDAPLDVGIQGRLHGEPWVSWINVDAAGTLMKHLSCACMIVLFYLSGIRVGEGLELQVGCCPEPPDDGEGAIRYEIYGRVFKGVRDQDGKPIYGGQPRELPWRVILPVVQAIRILERLDDGQLLFPARSGWNANHRRARVWSNDVLTSAAATVRIESFIAYANQLADQHGLPAERIPDDPEGSIVLKRFRRTIAWHIARLPGGRIALATQYGHLRASGITDGYSSRAKYGLRRLLDIETARAMADYLNDVAERINDGEGVSGPAAQRMIKAAKDAVVRFEGMFLTPRQADALLDEPQFNVYDNPDAFLTCNNDPSKALCHPERAGRAKREIPPAIDRCDPACSNIARTDTHISRLSEEITHLREEIGSPLTPTPLRERLKQRVTALQAIVDRHERTRVAIQTEPPRSHRDR